MTYGVRAEHGFTLVELLMASFISIAVCAAMFTMLGSAEIAFSAQPEGADVQQRSRLASEALHQDLLAAGAGFAAQDFAAGPSGAVVQGAALAHFFAPIIPYRARGANRDPVGTVRADAVTIVSLVQGCAHSVTAEPITRSSTQIPLVALSACPAADPLCCFAAGTDAIIFDGSGAWDPIAITAVSSLARQISRRATYDLTKDYQPGAVIAQATVRTYYLKVDDRAETYELRRYDADQTDSPVADNIVGLSFDYFGDPRPPEFPRPPRLDVVADEGYGAGENCVFRVAEGQQIQRLSDLLPGDDRLVPLGADLLSDGPWCPGPSNHGRFDADLLRVRQVRVTLRVQAASKASRGVDATLFSRPGFARRAVAYVPDQVIRFEVTPRNLNLGR